MFMLGSAANNAYHRRDTVEGINGLVALSAAAVIASSSSNDAAAKCEHDEEEAESTQLRISSRNRSTPVQYTDTSMLKSGVFYHFISIVIAVLL